MWNGNEVIARDWVEQSTRGWSKLPDPFGVDHQYGYAWHIYHFNVHGKVYSMYFAGDNGGQLVTVFPELDMVVNYNGGAYGEGQKFRRWQVFPVPQYLIPAALAEGRAALTP